MLDKDYIRWVTDEILDDIEGIAEIDEDKDIISEEDAKMCEDTYEGISSRIADLRIVAGDNERFDKCEAVLEAWHEEVRDKYPDYM